MAQKWVMEEDGGGFGNILTRLDPKPLGSTLSWLISLSQDKPFEFWVNPIHNQPNPQVNSRPKTSPPLMNRKCRSLIMGDRATFP